jgi:hypothetical protein
MVRKLLLLFFTSASIHFCGGSHVPTGTLRVPAGESTDHLTECLRLKAVSANVRSYSLLNGYSGAYCFLADMNLPSGQNRFFVYDLRRDSVVCSGLVAHGSCNYLTGLERVKFSNVPSCGCSSKGLYRVGLPYQGRFGRSYKLYGLDSSNSNAFRRAIVLHPYSEVPDHEVYPQLICNSLGCPMVAPSFFQKLEPFVRQSRKPLLLYVFQ